MIIYVTVLDTGSVDLQRLHYLLHVIAYNTAWLAAIVLASRECELMAVTIVLVTILVQLAWQTLVMKRTQGMLLMMFLFLIAGIGIDTFLYQIGLIRFSAHYFQLLSPLWMMSLWLSFSLTFYSTLQILYDKYLLLSALSFAGFPLAYSIGGVLHAAYFPYGYPSTLVVGILAAIVLPLVMKIYLQMQA